MLESYYKTAYTLARLRAGSTGPFVDGFADLLRSRGYAQRTVRGHLQAAAHLGVWMQAEGVALRALHESALDTFAAHFPTCACLKRDYGVSRDTLFGAHMFLKYLRELGVPVGRSQTTGSRVPHIVEEFESWMRHHRGVTVSTLRVRRLILVEFVGKTGNPKDYTAGALRRFVVERAALHGIARAKTVVSAIRMFMRWLVVQGLCDTRLVDAIPTIANWKATSLPVYLSLDDVERLVSSPDLATPVGRRDRAILLLLARLGVRAGDVTGLRATDIDWGAGMLHVTGKGRRRCRLPLPQDVGDAILAYMTDGRPKGPDDHVFLCARAPYRPFADSSTVSCIVVRAAERACVALPRGGAHVLRHSLATGLLRGGTPLPVISALLRHRSEETTTLYAKVDVVALRKIARPWPLEVSPC